MPATATDQLSAVFSALADPTRRAILDELAERDATVTELDRSVPDLDASGVAAPEGARARRPHLADAVGQVAHEPPRGRPAARRGRLDRALPAVLGLVPRPPRRPPCRGPGRRTRSDATTDNDPRGPGIEGHDHDTNAHELRTHVSRVFDAPRELVYRAFTDPDHLAPWWGPSGNSLPRDEIEFDVRPGGYQRWTEVSRRRARPSRPHPHRPHRRRRRRAARRRHARNRPAAGRH